MRRELIISCLLVAAIVAAYWPVHSYPPVALDDLGYVFQNPHVRNGLTTEGVARAFSDVTVANWHPLTMLSHMLDCQLFGASEKSAGWHHMVNLAFHAANTVLLFLAMRWLTGSVWPSALVAALFGLHPMHVESVAWIAERKDVLSTFFFMLVLLAYQRYAQRPTILSYAAVFVLLACGLMSKPMLVSVPFVLLLLDYWPLNRMRVPQVEAGQDENSADEGDHESYGQADTEESRVRLHIADLPDAAEGDEEENHGEANEPDEDEEADDDVAAIALEQRPADESGGRRHSADELLIAGAGRPLSLLVVEKIPLLVLAALSAVLTFLVQQGSGAMDMLGQPVPLGARVGNAIFAYGRYLEKSFWPSPLAAIYPYANRRLIDVLIVGIALGAISAAAIRLARIRPFLLVGWCWYLGTLVPVIGLVQVGMQGMADRYTYIPLIGIFIIVAWGADELMEDWPAWSKALAAAAVLGACGWLTWRQVATWSSSEALFRHAAEVEPYNLRAERELGMAYWEAGDLEKAQREFEAALNTKPDATVQIRGGREPIYRALGLLLAVRNMPQEALTQLDEAMMARPQQPEPPRHKAWILATSLSDRIRDGKKAVELSQQALDLSAPRQPAEYWDTLAAAQAEAGQFKEAVAAEEKALEKAQAVDHGYMVPADDLIPGIQARLKLFKSGRPYHAPAEHPLRQ